MQYKIIFAIVLWSVFSMASPVVTPSGLEGTLTYKSTVYMPRSFVPSNVQNHQQLMGALIHEHVKHLLGVFEQKPFASLNGLPENDGLGALGLGSLKNFKILSDVENSDGKGWDITYLAEHRLLMRRDVLAPNSSRKIKIVLPHNPVEFYVKACTDQEYYEKEYLFYYWNPFRKACHDLLVGKNSVDTIDAQIQSIGLSSETASPDYHALRDQLHTRGALKISLLFGFDIKSTDPGDDGRSSYEYFQDYFENKQHFEINHQQNTPTGPFSDYIRPASKGRYAVQVSMSLSASDVNSPIVFSRRAREGFENADIVMYVGHSGLGGNLDLAKLTRLSSPDPSHPEPIHFPNAYQIFFIDSCASFFFYSDEYAMARQGFHNVDIVTNGTASFFYTQNHETVKFLEPFINPNKAGTWDEILSNTESNGTARNFSYFLNVSSVK